MFLKFLIFKLNFICILRICRLKKIMDVMLFCKWIFIKLYVLCIKMGKWYFYICIYLLYEY